MTKLHSMSKLASLLALASLSACAGNAPPSETPTDTAAEPAAAAEPEAPPLAPAEETSDQMFVEGVAGGVMTSTITLEAEVVSVSQEKREAVLRGPEGNHVVVRVGEDAVNFYQVAVGDRVKVGMMRELVIYVNEDGAEEEQGAGVAAAGAEKGEQPAGAVVAVVKVTSKIEAMDTEARTATLAFEDGKKETFNVRPDVDMTQYKVGQEVVFLVTEMLALKVEKL